MCHLRGVDILSGETTLSKLFASFLMKGFFFCCFFFFFFGGGGGGGRGVYRKELAAMGSKFFPFLEKTSSQKETDVQKSEKEATKRFLGENVTRVSCRNIILHQCWVTFFI